MKIGAICKISAFFLAMFVLASPVAFAKSGVEARSASSRTEAIKSKLGSTDRRYVFVAMHRGDWRNFPENSKGAILSSIRLGADIVELDVQRTKDGKFILNHDDTLNRTTTGKGKVSDHTLAEIKKLKLRDSKGKPSEYDVLTLEEALELTRGKILVNIDKFTRHPREILEAVDAARDLDEGGTVHRRHARIGISLGSCVCVVDAEKILAVKGGGEAVMPRPRDRIGAVENGIFGSAQKGTEGGGGCRVADGVARALRMVCRVGQIVKPLML